MRVYKQNIAIIGTHPRAAKVAEGIAQKLEMRVLDMDDYLEYESGVPLLELRAMLGARFDVAMRRAARNLSTFEGAVVRAELCVAKVLRKFCYVFAPSDVEGSDMAVEIESQIPSKSISKILSYLKKL